MRAILMLIKIMAVTYVAAIKRLKELHSFNRKFVHKGTNSHAKKGEQL